MKLTHILVLIALAVVASITTLHFASDMPKALQPATVKNDDKPETAYDRIKSTGVIRCGYGVWKGLFEKDPNTGQLSGTAYDYVNKLAEKLSLKVDWAEETGWGEAVTSLRHGRIDMMCSGLWANSGRAREIDFVQPIYYNTIYAYAREGDARFDNNLAAANSPDTTIATIDGSSVGLIQQQDFPASKVVALSEMNSSAELLQMVAGSKADLAFADPASANEYIAANPGKIRRIVTSQPVRSFPLSIGINAGDYRLKRMLDIATEEMHNAGIIENIIRIHEKYPGSYLRVAPGYRAQ